MAKNLSGDLQVASANRLVDGTVVWLDEAGQWTDRLEYAAIARDKRNAEILLERARAEILHALTPRVARRHDGWLPDKPLQIWAVGEFAAQVAASDWLSGTGLSVYDALLTAAPPRVAVDDREPRVESVFAVGKRLCSPLTREELFALEPLYLRGSSAEEKAKEPRG